MSVRFECPRCQTVFEEASGDAAFAECPSCGALALPAAEATDGGGAALHLALSHQSLPDGAPVPSDRSDEAFRPQDSGAFGPQDKGVFGARDSGSFGSIDDGAFGPQDSGTFAPKQAGIFNSLVAEGQASRSEAAARASFSLDVDMNSGEGAALGDDPDGKTPPGGLPASLALTRGEAMDVPIRGSGHADFDDPTTAHASEEDRAAHDDEPPAPPAHRLLTQQTSAVPASDELGRIFDDIVLPQQLESELSSRARHAPPPSSSQEGGPELAATDERAATPWQASLSDEAFGDLERAFDDVALKPVEPPRAPPIPSSLSSGARPPPIRKRPPEGRKSGNAWAELMGVSEGSGEEELPRPPDKPKPPPLKLAKRKRPDALALSDEAKRLAFLPLGKPPGVPLTQPPRDAGHGHGDTEQIQRPPRRRGPAEGATDEVTSPDAQALPKRRGTAEVAHQVPVFQGFTALRIGALVIAMLLAGGGLGAYLAPAQVKAQTPRARAESKFIEGNKSYVEGRYDDAVGYYKGAISVDPTFALAHRAKGAALVKQQKFDEAADAYRQYLALQPDAIDAADVKEIIVRRDGKKPEPPVPEPTGE